MYKFNTCVGLKYVCGCVHTHVRARIHAPGRGCSLFLQPSEKEFSTEGGRCTWWSYVFMWKLISVVNEPVLLAQESYWPVIQVLDSLQLGTELLHQDIIGHVLWHQT